MGGATGGRGGEKDKSFVTTKQLTVNQIQKKCYNSDNI